MKIILSPHGDDELLGCYSVLDSINFVYVFKDDYRTQNFDSIETNLKRLRPDTNIRYLLWSPNQIEIKPSDTLYLPSKYDFHPFHKQVRQIGLTLPGRKMFYSTSMNTPWLSEEEDPAGKRALFEKLYPGEIETISKSDKYFLFKSIQSFDDIIYASVRFQIEGYHRWPSAPKEVEFLSSLHRHMFHFDIRVQQFQNDRDLEYFILSRKIRAWFESKRPWPEQTSCESYAASIKLWLSQEYPDRLTEIHVHEDGENGVILQ